MDLDQRPSDAQRLSDAQLLLTSGAYQEAEATAQAVLAEAPGNARATRLAGLAVAAMGETARAARILLVAAAADPDREHPCMTFARMEPQFPRRLVGRLFQACLLLAPDDARLRLAYAEYLIDLDDAAEAAAVLAEAPDTAPARHLRGLAQAELGRFAAALEDFRRATELDPQAAPSWSNLGMMLKIEGRFAEAITAHDRAVALAPADPRFLVNRAVAHLKSGQWDMAWPDYEARFDLPGAAPVDKARLLPPLGSGDDLSGVTIAALHEDGFGDTLHFCRYLPLLAAWGARVVACVPPALERVMRIVPGVAEVVTDLHALPAHDAICPMFSLPGVFRTSIETIPPCPRLVIDPRLLRYWGQQLPAGSALKVGLVWAGQARPGAPGFAALDRRRSAGLAAFAPLFAVPGVQFVSLQKGPPVRQEPPPGLALCDPMPQARDFADTAA
ncbi:MAG TPA: tetratricopeptide repeat protein, partial [Rhodopila sp.]|nr:tetratricopeptide repeat protein [Rhodopila sp.]